MRKLGYVWRLLFNAFFDIDPDRKEIQQVASPIHLIVIMVRVIAAWDITVIVRDIAIIFVIVDPKTEWPFCDQLGLVSIINLAVAVEVWEQADFDHVKCHFVKNGIIIYKRQFQFGSTFSNPLDVEH